MNRLDMTCLLAVAAAMVADGAVMRKEYAALGTAAQTGDFGVTEISIAAQEGSGETDLRDVVHFDDVIVVGRLAVGYNAYSGYAFGYDTLALMADTTQILFDDANVNPSFPDNDWRLVANDPTMGGSEYFAIEDVTAAKKVFVVEAGAPVNALYVNSQGDVGIKTSTPGCEIHVVDGDTPTIRLEQTGWAPEVWDIGGNEANFFIQDVTNGNSMPLRIEPSAPSDTVFLKSNGHVGIGTGLPGWPLELETTGEAATFVLDRTDGAMAYINAGGTYVNMGSCSRNHLRLMVDGVWRTQINTDGTLHMASGAYCSIGGVWTNSSSRELKENIERLSSEEAVETLAGLDPVKYNYKADKTDAHVGFIAEDVPDLVASADRKGMSPMDVTAVLTKVVQEQQRVIAELEARLAALEQEVRR